MTRYRFTTTGSLTDQSFTRTTKSRTCPTSSNWSTSLDTTYGGRKYLKEVWDVKTPRFQSLLECGKFLPLNPFTIRTSVDEILSMTFDHGRWFNPGQCAANPGRKIREIFGPYTRNRPWSLSIPDVPDGTKSAVVNAAVAEARNAVWDVLTDIAELRETIALFRSSAQTVFGLSTRLAETASRIARQTRKRPLKVFAELWLQYRYGWQPVVYSLQNAVETMNRDVPKWKKGRGYQEISDTLIDVEPFSGPSYAGEWSETLEFTQKVRGWAAAELMWQDNYRIDPLVTGYEVIPFSFIVDWFVDVGSWLEAISPFASGSTLGSCLSIQTSSKRMMFEHIWDTNTTESYGDGDSTGKIREEVVEEYIRLPYGTSLPGWNPRINLPRAVDAVALIIALASGTYRNLRI